MELIKEKWNKKDIDELNKYLYDSRLEDKIDFTKRVVNTNMEVLGIKLPFLKNISKEIIKGNYISYLDLNNFKYYECTVINSYIISKLKDIELVKKYIDNLYIDNWSTVDSISFNIKNNEYEYLELSKYYLNNKNPFKRRVGVRILFSYKKTNYLNEVFKIIDSLYKEEDYYVNMAVSWLLCELFIYNREETINYLKNNKLNKFTINKMISKCRDSYRVSDQDKELLLKYKM